MGERPKDRPETPEREDVRMFAEELKRVEAEIQAAETMEAALYKEVRGLIEKARQFLGVVDEKTLLEEDRRIFADFRKELCEIEEALVGEYLEQEGFDILDALQFYNFDYAKQQKTVAYPYEDIFSREEKERLLKVFSGFTIQEVEIILEDFSSDILETKSVDIQRLERYVGGIKSLGESYFELRKKLERRPPVEIVIYTPEIIPEIAEKCSGDGRILSELFGNVPLVAKYLFSLGNKTLSMEILEAVRRKDLPATLRRLYPEYGSEPRLFEFWKLQQRTLGMDAAHVVLQEERDAKIIPEAIEKHIPILKSIPEFQVGYDSGSRYINLNGYLLFFDLQLRLHERSGEEGSVSGALKKLGITQLSDFNEKNKTVILEVLEKRQAVLALKDRIRAIWEFEDGYMGIRDDSSDRELSFYHDPDNEERWVQLSIEFSFAGNPMPRVSSPLVPILKKHGILTLQDFLDKIEAILPDIRSELLSIAWERQQNKRMKEYHDEEFIKEFDSKIFLFNKTVQPLSLLMSGYGNDPLEFNLRDKRFFALRGTLDYDGSMTRGLGIDSFDVSGPERFMYVAQHYVDDFYRKFGPRMLHIDDLFAAAEDIKRWYDEVAPKQAEEKKELERESERKNKVLEQLGDDLWKKLEKGRKKTERFYWSMSYPSGYARERKLLMQLKFYEKGFPQEHELAISMQGETFHVQERAEAASGMDAQGVEQYVRQKVEEYRLQLLFYTLFEEGDFLSIQEIFNGEVPMADITAAMKKGMANFLEFLLGKALGQSRTNTKLYGFLFMDRYYNSLTERQRADLIRNAPNVLRPAIDPPSISVAKAFLSVVERMDQMEMKDSKAVVDSLIAVLTPSFCTFVIMSQDINLQNQYCIEQLFQKAEKKISALPFRHDEALDRIAFITNVLKFKKLDLFLEDKEGFREFLGAMRFNSLNSLLAILEKSQPYPELHAMLEASAMSFLAKGWYEIYKPFEAKILLGLAEKHPEYQVRVVGKILESGVVLEDEDMTKINALVKGNPELAEVMARYLRKSETSLLAYLSCCEVDFSFESIISEIENFEFVFQSEHSTRTFYQIAEEKYPALFDRLKMLALGEDERANVWLVGLAAMYYGKDKNHPELKVLREALPEAKKPFFDVQIKKVAIAQNIEKQYHVRPRSYLGLLDTVGTTEDVEKRFLEAVKEAEKFINEQIKAKKWGFQVTREEIVTTFMNEGGVLVLRNSGSSFHGFGQLGVDSYGSDLGNENLAHLTHPSLIGLPLSFFTNERGDRFKTFTDIDLEQGVFAVASMYAFKKLYLVRDLARAGTSIQKLTPEQQFFWTTVYYNSGQGAGRDMLKAKGVKFAGTPWPREDSYSKHSRSSQYNATWRLASFRLIRDTKVLDMKKEEAVPEEAPL